MGQNWLFIESENAKKVSAILHSLILNCEAHRVNPQDCLTGLKMQDPVTLRENVDHFLPSTWMPPDGFVAGEYPLIPKEYLATEIQEPSV